MEGAYRTSSSRFSLSPGTRKTGQSIERKLYERFGVREDFRVAGLIAFARRQRAAPLQHLEK